MNFPVCYEKLNLYLSTHPITVAAFWAQWGLQSLNSKLIRVFEARIFKKVLLVTISGDLESHDFVNLQHRESQGLIFWTEVN